MVTDCMNMHAVSHNFEPGEAAVRAVVAGCDLVLVDQWELAYEALLHAILEDSCEAVRCARRRNGVRTLKRDIRSQAETAGTNRYLGKAKESVGTHDMPMLLGDRAKPRSP